MILRDIERNDKLINIEISVKSLDTDSFHHPIKSYLLSRDYKTSIIYNPISSPKLII